MVTAVPSFARVREKDMIFERNKDVRNKSCGTTTAVTQGGTHKAYTAVRTTRNPDKLRQNPTVVHRELPVVVQSVVNKPVLLEDFPFPPSTKSASSLISASAGQSADRKPMLQSIQIMDNLSRAIKPLKKHNAETFRDALTSSLNCEITSVGATRLMHKLERAEDRNELSNDNLRKIIRDTPSIIYCPNLDKKAQDIRNEPSQASRSATASNDKNSNSIPHFMLPKRNSSTRSSMTYLVGLTDYSLKTNSDLSNTDLTRNASASASKPNSDHNHLINPDVKPEVLESLERDNELEVAGQLLVDVGNTFQSYSSHTHEFSNGTTIQLLTKYDYKIILTQLGIHEDAPPKSGYNRSITEYQLDRLVTLYRTETSEKFNIIEAPGVDFENFCQSLIDVANYSGYEAIDILREVAAIMPSKPFNVVVNDLSSDPGSEKGSDKGELIKEDIAGVIVEVPNLLDNAERRSTMPLSALSTEERAQLIKEKLERKRERALIRTARNKRKQIRQREENALNYTTTPLI